MCVPVSYMQKEDASWSSSSDQQIDDLLSDLNYAAVRLSVFGEFSAGKTTVLNALIGEEILSVAVEPTTAVPTRVRYGREFNVFVERIGGTRSALFEDDPPFWTRFVGRRETLSTLEKQQGTIRDFLRTWTKEGQRADEVDRVVIEIPLDWLKKGIELVDTPGVNNEFARHQGFTKQEAADADIAVLLMDARQGGGKRTEFAFMNEVQQQVERCIVVPNKMDRVPTEEREEFLDYIREVALPAHWDGAVTPPVMGISALAALHSDEHDEPDLVVAFDALRERLETIADEERGRLLLARKGHPERHLFARAKELEAESQYGQAHRIYFDLLDVLDAADLDPTPAREGIARCESHLSVQVDALDKLNACYNEAMARAEDDPDAALERLEAIRDEKEELRLKDGDLYASIEALETRIEDRDAARREIRRVRAVIEQHRQNEAWIEAAETAQTIRPPIETAELSEEQAAELKQFVATQEQDRDDWAGNRWGQIKDEVDACMNELQYLNAETRLDDLRVVAPYTPFEEETAEIVEEVEKMARLEEKYRLAVREAIEEAKVLRQGRVDPKQGQAVESVIKTIESSYWTLFGFPDLPKRPPIENSALPLTIDQKLGLALQLHALADRSPKFDIVVSLAKSLKERRNELRTLDTAAQTGLDLVEEYPDHPEAKVTLDELLNERLPFWALPSQIRRTRSAIEEYQDYLSGDGVEERVKELEERAAVFQWGSENSPLALMLLLFGLFLAGVVVSTPVAIPGIIVGILLIGGGLLIQYFQPIPQSRKWERKRDSDQNRESPKKSSPQKLGGRAVTREADGEARPAGIWKCPNCGNSKQKGKGFTKVPCQRCGTEMRLIMRIKS